MNNSEIINNTIEFFKKDKAFIRLFYELRKKWKKQGGVSGYITLEHITDEERDVLNKFLDMNIQKSEYKFKAKDLESALIENGFNMGIKELLEGYYDEELITNKELRKIEVNEKQSFCNSIIEELKSKQEYLPEVISWLEELLDKKTKGYMLILSGYRTNMEDTFKTILIVCKAVNYIYQISNERVELIDLSYRLTGTQDYFHHDCMAGKLLIYALCNLNSCEYPKDYERLLELYYISGIIVDSVASSTSLFGIDLYNEQGEHRAFEEFVNTGESFVVTLSNLKKIVKADCSSKKVFIVESHKVFAELCNYFKDHKVSIICTLGHMKASTLILINMLYQSGCNLYYSSDFNPDGLLMADKVIKRTNGKANLWRLDYEDYQNCISDDEITYLSLKQLDKVKDAKLKKILNELRVHKKIGYQERLIEKLKEDIKNL